MVKRKKPGFDDELITVRLVCGCSALSRRVKVPLLLQLRPTFDCRHCRQQTQPLHVAA